VILFGYLKTGGMDKSMPPFQIKRKPFTRQIERDLGITSELLVKY